VVEEQVKPSETSPIAVDAAPEQIRDRYLAELEAVQVVRELPFTSNVRALGRLIVALRSLWNSISTKWYVRPLIQQQTDFNIRVVGYLRIVQEQFEIIGWLSRRVDQLEIGGNEQGRLLQGQLRDAAQNIRELTVLAEQVAALKAQLTAEVQDRSDSGREET